MAQQVYFRTNAHIVEWASTLARNGHQFVIADAFPHPNITFRASQEYVDGFLNNDDFLNSKEQGLTSYLTNRWKLKP